MMYSDDLWCRSEQRGIFVNNDTGILICLDCGTVIGDAGQPWLGRGSASTQGHLKRLPEPSMPVSMTRLDLDMQLPAYQTPGAVGFDLAARLETHVLPERLARIPTGMVVRVPAGYALLVCARSSTPERTGLHTPHGIGVIDQDYCGPDDEILVQVYNTTSDIVMIARGERIAQGIFVRTARARWVEGAINVPTSRGGFGSTGEEQ